MQKKFDKALEEWLRRVEKFGPLPDYSGDKMWDLGCEWEGWHYLPDHVQRLAGSRKALIEARLAANDWQGPKYPTCKRAGVVWRFYNGDKIVPLPWYFFSFAKCLGYGPAVEILKHAHHEQWSPSWFRHQVRRARSPWPEPQGVDVFTDLDTALDMDLPQFNAVVADCPWKFDDKGRPFGGTARHWDCMETERIEAMGPKVQRLVAPNSLLFLWTPVPLIMDDGRRVMAAWGFEYVQMFFWHKTQYIGPGKFFRNEVEVALIGVRGQVGPFHDNSLRSWLSAVPEYVEAPSGERFAAKPQEFFSIVERAVPGPLLELFGNKARGGRWTVIGNHLSPLADRAAAD
jgi:N6-adenosine-specific RNA methylase IME4